MAKKYTNSRSISFEVNGIEEYLKKIAATGKDIDDVVGEAIYESAKPIFNDIEAWADRHKRSGVMAEGVDLSQPTKEGNNISVQVGINDEKAPGAWHAVFTEYGTPTQPADPGIRTAFERNKSKVKKIQRDVLKKAGMPVD